MDVLILDCGDSIKGECTLTNYVGKIELLSYSLGVAQQITGDQSDAKRISGKPNHQDFTVTKYQDLASCNLINNCNTATTIPTVTVTVGQNDNGNVTPTWVYVLTNALISSISVGGGGGGKRPGRKIRRSCCVPPIMICTRMCRQVKTGIAQLAHQCAAATFWPASTPK